LTFDTNKEEFYNFINMLYLIIFIGLLFIGLGALLTVNNAKYLLSGYNTMSEEERHGFDIQGYIPFFKSFHYKLGASFIFLGAFLLHFFGEKMAGFFIGTYPILAYIYFIWAAMKFSNGLNENWNKIGILVLAVTLVFVVVLFLKDGF